MMINYGILVTLFFSIAAGTFGYPAFLYEDPVKTETVYIGNDVPVVSEEESLEAKIENLDKKMDQLLSVGKENLTETRKVVGTLSTLKEANKENALLIVKAIEGKSTPAKKVVYEQQCSDDGTCRLVPVEAQDVIPTDPPLPIPEQDCGCQPAMSRQSGDGLFRRIFSAFRRLRQRSIEFRMSRLNRIR
jgi:hypothetical protein